MTTKQVAITVGTTVLILLVLLSQASGQERTIRVYDSELAMKNMSVGGVNIYISLNGEPYMDPNKTTQYYMVMVENTNKKDLSLKKLTADKLVVSRPIASNIQFYEVKDFVEHNETDPFGNQQHYYDVTFVPLSSDATLPKQSTKWFIISFETPNWEEATFNVTMTAAGQDITLDPSIGSCATTITSAGVYTLSGNLACTGHGIKVNGSDIEINVKGYTIDGDDGVGDYGIYNIIYPVNNVSIYNGSIKDFGRNIYFDAATNFSAYNLSITSACTGCSAGTGWEVLVTASTNGASGPVSIYENTLSGTGAEGITIGVASGTNNLTDALVSNNTMTSATDRGLVYFYNAGTGTTITATIDHNNLQDDGSTNLVSITGTYTIDSNTLYSTTGNGVLLNNTEGATITDNTIYAVGNGIYLNSSAETATISGNTIYRATTAAIHLKDIASDSTDDVSITLNTLSNSTVAILGNGSIAGGLRNNLTYNTIYNVSKCVWLSGYNSSYIYDNDCSNATDNGFYLDSSSTYNIIDDNDVFNVTPGDGSPDAGIYLGGSDYNNITNNVVNWTAGDGIQMLSGADSNLVSGNSIYHNSKVLSGSCIGTNSNANNLSSNNCEYGYDGITINSGGILYLDHVNVSHHTHYGFSLGAFGSGSTFDNLTAHNISSGVVVQGGFVNATEITNALIYNATTFITATTANQTNWKNVTMGYNTSHGLVHFDAFNLTTKSITEATNVYFDPTYISVNTSALPTLAQPATLTFLSEACAYDYLWNSSGFYGARNTIVINGEPVGTVSCSGSTVEYNVSSFSSWTLWSSNTTYNVSYADPSGHINISCWQPYMNSSEPDYQTTSHGSVLFTNALGSTLYNLTLATNESLSGINGTFNLFAWTTPYRPANQSQNWSNTGNGIVYIPRQITESPTVVLRRLTSGATVQLWFWGDCINVTDNQSKTFEVVWGGG